MSVCYIMKKNKTLSIYNREKIYETIHQSKIYEIKQN